MPPAGRARLEGRPRHVPLEQVDAPAPLRGDVGELVDEQALAGAGKAGEEHEAPAGEGVDVGGEPGIGPEDDARFA